MPLPTASEARRFYQSAIQRFLDAEFLLENERTTGAVYLAGYGVECMLKALILAGTPRNQRLAVLGTFRGRRAHDYAWLRHEYYARGAAPLPKNVAKCFAILEPWGPELRYVAGMVKLNEAKAFLESARRLSNGLTKGYEMPRSHTLKKDAVVEAILGILKDYLSAHPRAKVDVQRQNNVSVRVRIIDPDFLGMDRVERHDLVWTILDRLPDDVLSNLTFLLLLTPDETKKSLANMDFENPLPSDL